MKQVFRASKGNHLDPGIESLPNEIQLWGHKNISDTSLNTGNTKLKTGASGTLCKHQPLAFPADLFCSDQERKPSLFMGSHLPQRERQDPGGHWDSNLATHISPKQMRTSSKAAFRWEYSNNFKRNLKNRSNYSHACPSKMHLTPTFLRAATSLLLPHIQKETWEPLECMCVSPQSLFSVTHSICPLPSVRRSSV